MTSIEYLPKYSRIKIDKYIYLSDKDILINTNRFSTSLKKKVDFVNALYNSLEMGRIVIGLSLKLIKSDKLQNILWNLLKVFLPWDKKNLKMIITSEIEEDRIYDIIGQILKIHDARLLATLPANLGYPEIIGHHIKEIFKNEKNVKITVMDDNDLKKHGFGLIRVIGNSAKHKSRLVIIERNGSKKDKTICIVGKGVTFDSGGLTIKPYEDMIDMKYDKIGAVYGAYALLHLVEDSKLRNKNLIGVFPLVENAVSENSVRPGDVVRSYGGKTVEITTPDAEGRLLLADAFEYVNKNYKIDLLIDIATLTGHNEIISCWHSGTIYTENKKMENYIEECSYNFGERMIAMPTWNDKDDILKSTVADIVNDPISCSDSFMAARFLRYFVPDNVKWLHIDLAHELRQHLPTGNGIQTLIEVVRKNDIYY